ncbi:protein kinase domain-containing protein [Salinactinospora qingdaonensis]|uniref:Protein kinase domain-containing protein n=1 Tax=Salinactinospora qingdaonensis TaxID=702744 RepID=A0ABP7FMB2_9ACTN
MVTPEPPDPTAPLPSHDESTDPAAPTTRITATRAATRRLTAFFAPRGRSPSPAERTATLPAQPSSPTRVDAPGARGAAPARWRRVVAKPLNQMGRLAGRILADPGGELDYFEYTVPAEVRRHYTVVDHIGSGGEAVVYLAEPAAGAAPAGNRQVALKIYRPGHDLNRELLERLRARGESSPHTPAIHGYGHARSSWGETLAWEAQEYFAAGSLRTLMEQAPLPQDRAGAIVAAVAECLHYWQDSLQHNHTDVKPENLLVRSLDPPVFALTDFGGAVRATMSRVYGGLAITEDYAAPEVVEGRREAPAAWWSLGVIVHELVTGRRPARGENWLSARSSEIDVSAVPDGHWRLLARGLLAPVPESRWGYREVTAWLAGEKPKVVKARRHAPIRFGDVSHDDPPSLAFDLLDRSETGALWLRTHWPELRTWLDREVNDYTFDRSYLTRLRDHPDQAHLAISALAARFVPGMVPRYRGHEVTAAGVLALATGDSSRYEALREAIELGALGLAARHWCTHPTCQAEGTNRCALLERVQHEVPLVMRRVAAEVDRLVRAGDGSVVWPGQHEWNVAWANATELVLDPEAPGRYRRMLRAQSWHPAQRSTAPRSQWWLEQRRAGLRGTVGQGEIATPAAIVTAVLLLPSAARAGAVEREQRRAATRQRWRSRWQRANGAVSQGWEGVRSRWPRRDRDAGGPGEQAPREGRWRWRGQDEPGRERDRVERGMRRLQRAMRAGRCRRFAYPAAGVALLDGAGQWLWHAQGLYSNQPWMASALQGVETFGQSGLVSAVAGAAASVMGLVPGGVGVVWWFPVLLAVALVLLGHTAANRRRKARSQLVARRLAIIGTALTGVRVLASGLFYLAMGVLIPLSLITG